MTRFRRKVCRLFKLLVQELPQTPLPEQSAAVHSAPAVVSAPVRLPVQLFAHQHVPVSAAPARVTSCHAAQFDASGGH